jgi:hypothetical protein
VNKASDFRTAIAAAARDMVVRVNVSGLIARHATKASHAAADQQARLSYMKALEDQLGLRADIVDNLLTASPNDFYQNLARVPESSDHVTQEGIVDDLRSIIRPDNPANKGIKQHAAVAIHYLYMLELPAVTEADNRAALPICGCKP